MCEALMQLMRSICYDRAVRNIEKRPILSFFEEETQRSGQNFHANRFGSVEMKHSKVCGDEGVGKQAAAAIDEYIKNK